LKQVIFFFLKCLRLETRSNRREKNHKREKIEFGVLSKNSTRYILILVSVSSPVNLIDRLFHWS